MSGFIFSPALNRTVPYDECTLKIYPVFFAQLPYAPNLAGNVLYLSIFAFCLALNLSLGFWYRTWGYLVGMSIGCLLEVLGYVGRIQTHHNPFPQNPFLLYLICVTIASIFFTAAIYVCLARMVVAFGERASYFRPRTYTFTFIISDFISLLLQAGGGTIVSMADNFSFENIGLHIMQAGLIFQVAALLFFIVLCIAFFWRCYAREDLLDERFELLRSTRRFKFFLLAQAIATIAILTRCAFRVAELSQGFKGHIWFDEVDYMVLEGAMVSIGIILLTIGHPGLNFQGRYREANFKLVVRKEQGRRSNAEK
ncbi:putative RTA1 domain protein [Rhizodiscina lignyota]|uniref:RTA1 domain protein n=1 Tax=Rhizodiscina lignyota TaxID=1504668 RepID=A0A9P4I7G4_9PEZI|nr:putative RTA1 domain protein [Rhizodiscina lignyota]